jgi:hypothetical protein
MGKRAMKALRFRSGDVKTKKDPLTSFLYELMRDHMTPGEVEYLVLSAVNEPEDVSYSNGWLAEYAADLAGRLRGEIDTEEGLPPEEDTYKLDFGPADPDAALRKALVEDIGEGYTRVVG